MFVDDNYFFVSTVAGGTEMRLFVIQLCCIYQCAWLIWINCICLCPFLIWLWSVFCVNGSFGCNVFLNYCKKAQSVLTLCACKKAQCVLKLCDCKKAQRVLKLCDCNKAQCVLKINHCVKNIIV